MASELRTSELMEIEMKGEQMGLQGPTEPPLSPTASTSSPLSESEQKKEVGDGQPKAEHGPVGEATPPHEEREDPKLEATSATAEPQTSTQEYTEGLSLQQHDSGALLHEEEVPTMDEEATETEPSAGVPKEEEREGQENGTERPTENETVTEARVESEATEPEAEVTPKVPPRAWEPCVIPAEGGAPVECVLPSSLALLGDLSHVLNANTWNELLTEEERDQLRALLPGESVEEKEDTVESLLGGENFFFGNPVTTFFRDLKNGFYHREVVRYKAKVEELQRRKYELDLMSYRGRQLQQVLAWKHSAGLVAPGSAESRVLENPPRRIYAMSRNENGWESSPASRKRKRRRDERTGQSNKENETPTPTKRHKKKPKKHRTKYREREADLEEEEEEDDDDGDDYVVHSRKDNRRVKADAGDRESKKMKNKERDEAEAEAASYPIIFVFFGKLKEAFRALDNCATLDDLVAKLKAGPGNVEDDRLPQYPLKKFVKLALEFLASPPPPTAPFSLGSASASSSSSPLGSASGGSPHRDAVPIVRFERAKNVWRWVAKEHKVSVNRLQSVEQLFYFAAARNMVDSKTGNLTLATVKQHKCTNTIETSSPEATASHRLQETDRYNNPERAFTYVTNGMKAVVGPVKHTGSATRGPSNKPREHFLLKTKRPAHVNLLGLVRDAAARLPGGVGTRPDVAILLKDSQWVVEEIPNGKLNTVVSGALDRLHSQNDPCVRFDPDQKLWIYLHRLRKENDFEVQPFPKPKSKKAQQMVSSPSTPSAQQSRSPQQLSGNGESLSSPPSPAQHVISSSPPSSPDSSSSAPCSPPPPPRASTSTRYASSPKASPSSSSSALPSTSTSSSSLSSFPSSQVLNSPPMSPPVFPSLTLHPLPHPGLGSAPSRQSPTPTPSFSSPSSLGTFRPLHLQVHQHLSAHAGSGPPSLATLPFMHYSTVPPPTPLPPLHPHPATSMTLHPPFSPMPLSSSPSLSPSSSGSLPFTAFTSSSSTAPLPRLHLPPVQQSTSHNWHSGY